MVYKIIIIFFEFNFSRIQTPIDSSEIKIWNWIEFIKIDFLKIFFGSNFSNQFFSLFNNIVFKLLIYNLSKIIMLFQRNKKKNL